MSLDGRRRPGPQDLLDMKDSMATAALALSGQFDEQIKVLREAKEQLENSQFVHRTLAEAEQIKHAALEFSAGEREQVAGIVAKAEEHRLEIHGHILEAKTVLERSIKEKDLTASRWLEFERDKGKWTRQRDEAEATLRRREEMVAEREAKIGEKEAEVALQRAKLVTRLRNLEKIDESK